MRATRQTIFKVQVSSWTNAGVPQALIYNEKRTALWEGALPEDLRPLLRPYPAKYYFYGHIDTERRIVLDAQVPESQEPEW